MPYSHRINAINARCAGPSQLQVDLPQENPFIFGHSYGAHVPPFITMGPTLWDVSVPVGIITQGVPQRFPETDGFHVVGQPFKNETSDHSDVFLFFRFKQMLVVHNYRFSDPYSMRWCSSIQRFWLNNRPILWYLGG